MVPLQQVHQEVDPAACLPHAFAWAVSVLVCPGGPRGLLEDTQNGLCPVVARIWWLLPLTPASGADLFCDNGLNEVKLDGSVSMPQLQPLLALHLTPIKQLVLL